MPAQSAVPPAQQAQSACLAGIHASLLLAGQLCTQLTQRPLQALSQTNRACRQALRSSPAELRAVAEVLPRTLQLFPLAASFP